jgi:uncharacterized protein YqgC (DUF456 family)
MVDATTLLWVAAGVTVVTGFVGIFLPLLPGVPLIFGGLWLAAWISDFEKVGVATLVALAVLAVLAWIVDYVAAALGVRRVGASRLAVGGATVGAVVGMFGGLPGLIAGPILGAMLGEWYARRDTVQATRAGLAAGAGFLAAIAAKLAIAGVMVGTFAFAWLY